MSRGREIRRRSAESKTDPTTGTIVLLDQEPLRATVAGDCASVLARLDCARAGWHRFERKDKPAFVRWRAREFGVLLSTAREVEERIRDAQTIVHEVEMEMRRIFQDAASAYQRVMFRRAHPAVTTQEESDYSRDRRGPERKLSDFEKEALFQEWVKSSLGTNPDKMDDEAYSTTFEAFKSHMFHVSMEGARPRQSARSGKAIPATPREPAASPELTEEGAAPVDMRVRELYRRLVRRLHPDLRADGSTAVSALWHEVQEAYAASDVAQMEILLALSDIEANRMTDQTLAQLHAVRAELRRALRALEKSLLEAESEDAWDFARIGPNAGLRVRVERQLKSDLAGRTQRLDLLTQTIAEWARGPLTNRKAQLV